MIMYEHLFILIACDRTFYAANVSGKPNEMILESLCPKFSKEERKMIADEKEKLFRNLATSLTPLGGLPEFIDFLKKFNIFVGCVTNAPRINAEFMLEMIDLRSKVDVLIIGEECEDMKPSPIPYLNAVRDFQSRYHKSNFNFERLPFVIFEDSFSGVLSGVKAGGHVIGVETTHSSSVFLTHGCIGSIKDYTELDWNSILELKFKTLNL